MGPRPPHQMAHSANHRMLANTVQNDSAETHPWHRRNAHRESKLHAVQPYE